MNMIEFFQMSAEELKKGKDASVEEVEDFGMIRETMGIILQFCLFSSSALSDI